jgi:hypothetical protein
MSSGTEIIQDALKEIGAYSVASPAAPESITDVMRKLNSMVQSWESLGIKTGMVPLEVPGNELSEPMDIRNAVVENLAISAAPLFDNAKAVVSAELRMSAAKGMAHAKKFYQIITVPQKTVSSTMPLGAGNRRDEYIGWDNFAGKDFKIGTN